jgi:hypothetical protein
MTAKLSVPLSLLFPASSRFPVWPDDWKKRRYAEQRAKRDIQICKLYSLLFAPFFQIFHK